MDHTEYKLIWKYLSEKKYPEKYTENQKRALRTKIQKFVIEKEELFYVCKDQKRKVITTEKNNSIMENCHALDACHLGRDKTFDMLKTRYYWNGMVKDVKDFIQSCHKCQIVNKKTVTTVSEMTVVPVPPCVINQNQMSKVINQKKTYNRNRNRKFSLLEQ